MAIFLGNSNGGPGGGGGSYTAGDGITIASNVISFGGSIANPVTIQIDTSQSLTFRNASGSVATIISDQQFQTYSDNGTQESQITLQGGGIILETTNDTNFGGGFIQTTDTAAVLSVNLSGQGKAIIPLTSSVGDGIQVIDSIENLGLVGDADFSANAKNNNLAYAQVSTVKALISQNTVTPNVYSIDTPGQTSTQTIGSITVSNPAIYRVNVYGLWRSGLGSTDIQINYTNLDSDPVTIDLGTVAVGNENLNSPAYVIKSAGGGAIIEVVATLTGAGIYDCGLTIELLF